MKGNVNEGRKDTVTEAFPSAMQRVAVEWRKEGAYTLSLPVCSRVRGLGTNALSLFLLPYGGVLEWIVRRLSILL